MRLPNIDTVSFWIGFILSSILWGFVAVLRPAIQQALSNFREQQEAAKLQADTGIEDTYRKLLYKQTQGMHIAASLFSLDEIAEPVRLLAPPALIEPGTQLPFENITTQTIPYMLAWPELASTYQANTLTIPEALQGGMNLVLVGSAGSGKTVALASLASQIARRAPEAQSLHDFVPYLIHVADLTLPLPDIKKPEDLLEPIIEQIRETAPLFSLNRIPGMVINSFKSGRALLLLDGVDELPNEDIKEVSQFLRLMLQSFPKAKIVTTGAPEYLNGLLSLGFFPLAVMPWNAQVQSQFLAKWESLWKQYVAVEAWAQNINNIDSILINRWLEEDNLGLSPLEYTLKLWGAYAGDARGARAMDAIDAHIRRLSPQGVPFDALQLLGAQAMVNSKPLFDIRTGREWTKSFEVPEASMETLETEVAEGEPAAMEESSAESAVAETTSKPEKGKLSAKASLVGNLINTGLLINQNNRLRFVHPTFAGFLAGRALGGYNNADSLMKQPNWSGKTISLQYFAAFGDASTATRSLLEQDDPLLKRPALLAGKMLKEAPRNASWRAPVMAALLAMLQNEDLPTNLRMQAACAFVLSNDPSVTTLFRQLLSAPSSTLRQIASLACGMLADQKAVDGLANTVFQTGGITAQAACLALVQIGTQQALETVATALLQGDEDLRRAAAEALAKHPQDGHEALREGTESKDILVRRAVVFGLANIEQNWATALLEKVQVEDEQWAVRNVTVEMLAARNSPNRAIPKKLTAPSETPWLIEFAGRFGSGIQRGEAATDTLLLAVKSGETPEIKLGALHYLRYSPSEGVMAALYPYLYDTDAEMREAVYLVLQEYAMAGVKLPEPKQFGLG